VARQNEDLDMLNTLATEMSKTFQVELILQKATALAKTALNAKAGWCYLLEDDMLVLQESEGLSERYTHGMKRLKPGSGTEGMAIARNELMIRDGLLFHSGRERDLVKEEGLYTVAAVPLCHQDRVIGALSVGWRDPKQQCSLRDKRMLMAVSQQVVWAVVNARMFNRIREEAHTWESSYRALQHVNEMLSHRAEALEEQLQDLRHVEQQVWTILAASQRARYIPEGMGESDEELVNTLKKLLAAIG
jgi:GAF domain-containing protein